MGIVFIIAGILLILLAAAGFAVSYRILSRKKQAIRDEITKICS